MKEVKCLVHGFVLDVGDFPIHTHTHTPRIAASAEPWSPLQTARQVPHPYTPARSGCAATNTHFAMKPLPHDHDQHNVKYTTALKNVCFFIRAYTCRLIPETHTCDIQRPSPWTSRTCTGSAAGFSSSLISLNMNKYL